MSPASPLSEQNVAVPSTDLIALLKEVSDQNRVAFSALYQATHLKLFGVIIRILRRKSLAEDVLQEVYIKIWEKADTYVSSRGSAIAWMCAIARNLALDQARRPQFLSSEEIEGIENIEDMKLGPLDLLKSSEEHERLTKCLKSIDEEKQKVILMAYHFGMSREYIAKISKQPVATIKTWLRRSLQSLKKCLES